MTTEAGVMYHQVPEGGRPEAEVRKNKALSWLKPYRYEWKSPQGHVGTRVVLCRDADDLLSLLGHWSRNGWEYKALPA